MTESQAWRAIARKLEHVTANDYPTGLCAEVKRLHTWGVVGEAVYVRMVNALKLFDSGEPYYWPCMVVFRRLIPPGLNRKSVEQRILACGFLAAMARDEERAAKRALVGA